MKISHKLILGFLIVIVVFSSALLLSISVTRSEMINQVGENNLTFARDIADRLDQRVNTAVSSLKIISLDPEIVSLVAASNQEYDQMEDREAFMEEREKEWFSLVGKDNPIFNELFEQRLSQRLEIYRQDFKESSGIDIIPELIIANKYGATIAENNRTTDWDQSNRLQFQNSRDYGVHVSDLYYDGSAGVWALELAVAIYDGDEFAGMLKTAYNIEDIIAIVLDSSEESPYDDFQIFLFSGNDDVIYSGNTIPAEIGSSAEDGFIGYDVIDNADEGFNMVSVDGINRLESWSTSDGYRNYPGLGWKVVMSIPEEEFLRATDELRNISISITVLAIIISIIISAVLFRSIVNPIHELTKMSTEISKGNLEYRTHMKTTGAIGDLAKTLNLAAEKIQESQKRKDEFAGMISHELKTPLVPMRGYLEMLKNPKFGELNEDQKEAVDEIYSNTLHLEKLITNILISEKLEANEIQYYPEKIDVEEFMSDETDLLTSLTSKKNIELITSIKAKNTFADPKILKDIFSGLVENAIEFVSEENGRIEIGVTDGEHEVTFYVKDNGIGISKENQKELFKKFHQVDTSHTRKHGGTGLGLAICYGYVTGMNGKIWVESKEDMGSTFFFTIPKDE